MDLISVAVEMLVSTLADVAPIAIFLLLFQTVILRRPLAHKSRLLLGFGLVVVGLGLFLAGLEQALFPLGRLMAEQLTGMLAAVPAGELRWYDYYWVYAFGFAIGFGTTIAEPALLAVALKANEVSGGTIHVWGLRVAVALGVAVAVALGCLRIVTGTPLQWYFIAGYLIVIVQTALSPRSIVPLAYDSGGVTTSTVTVPLVTALGLGLAANVPGRNVLLDGFGIIAFASLVPIMSVLAYAQLASQIDKFAELRRREKRRTA
jgi:Protein of unknown function (DUF1538)